MLHFGIILGGAQGPSMAWGIKFWDSHKADTPLSFELSLAQYYFLRRNNLPPNKPCAGHPVLTGLQGAGVVFLAVPQQCNPHSQSRG